MLACASCGRFVREDAGHCPFCEAKVGSTRAPVATVFGILLGVCVAACGDDGGSMSDTGSGSTASGSATSSPTEGSASMTSSGTSNADSTGATGTNTTDSATTGPLYGPITTGESLDGTTGGTDSGTDSGSTDTGGTSQGLVTGSTGGAGSDQGDIGDTGLASDGIQPLYGPVVTTGN